MQLIPSLAPMLGLVIFAVILALALAALAALLKSRGATGHYAAAPLMTDNEAEFFGRLVTALPDHYIFPQVAMSALLRPSAADRKRAHADRLRIAQQRVDYVVCNRACEVIAAVELDDRTHSAEKDRLRDARLTGAGIRIVRFQSRSKPRAELVRTTVLGIVPAVAPAAAMAASVFVAVPGSAERYEGPRREPALQQ